MLSFFFFFFLGGGGGGGQGDKAVKTTARVRGSGVGSVNFLDVQCHFKPWHAIPHFVYFGAVRVSNCR